MILIMTGIRISFKSEYPRKIPSKKQNKYAFTTKEVGHSLPINSWIDLIKTNFKIDRKIGKHLGLIGESNQFNTNYFKHNIIKAN